MTISDFLNYPYYYELANLYLRFNRFQLTFVGFVNLANINDLKLVATVYNSGAQNSNVNKSGITSQEISLTRVFINTFEGSMEAGRNTNSPLFFSAYFRRSRLWNSYRRMVLVRYDIWYFVFQGLLDWKPIFALNISFGLSFHNKAFLSFFTC